MLLIEKLLKQTDIDSKRFAEMAKAGERYYRNENDILRTGAAAIDEVNGYLKKLGKNPLHSADNRIPTNWHRVITDQKAAYLFTYPPQFDLGDKDLNDLLMKILGDDYKKIVNKLCIDATNTGVAWLQYWHNVGEPFEYYFIDPMQIRVVFDESSIKPKMKYLIRSYIVILNGEETMRYELWTKDEVTYYLKPKKGEFTQDGEVIKHTYGEIPFICFKNNGLMISDLVMYKKIIDNIDKILSGFANDVDDIQEIIWLIKNYAGETTEFDYDKDGNPIERDIDLLQKLKAKKFFLVDEDGGAEAIHNEIPFEARTRLLEELRNQLFVSSMSVDPKPERIGQATGVFIEFLYGLLELKAGLMQNEFEASLNKLVRAILKYLGKDENLNIEQRWTRTRPKNNLETVQMITATPSTVLSDETKTKEHPLIENWQDERDKIKQEQEASAKNSFSLFNGEQ